MKDRVKKQVCVTGSGGIRFSSQASAYLHGLMDGALALALILRIPRHLHPWAQLEENLLVILPEDVPPANTRVQVEILEIYAVARVSDDMKPEGKLCNQWARHPIGGNVTFWFDGNTFHTLEEAKKRA